MPLQIGNGTSAVVLQRNHQSKCKPARFENGIERPVDLLKTGTVWSTEHPCLLFGPEIGASRQPGRRSGEIVFAFDEEVEAV